MRWVTANPPNMLIAVSAIPTHASQWIHPSGRTAPPLAGSGAARPEQWIHWLAWVGIALTAINMFGGFAVTQRMLQMFRK